MDCLHNRKTLLGEAVPDIDPDITWEKYSLEGFEEGTDCHDISLGDTVEEADRDESSGNFIPEGSLDPADVDEEVARECGYESCNEDSNHESSSDEYSSDCNSREILDATDQEEEAARECGCESCASLLGSSISEHNDDDDDDDADDDLEQDFSEDDDNGHWRQCRDRVTCVHNGPFLLEKLPPEIRRLIFGLLMPDDRHRPLNPPVGSYTGTYACCNGKDVVETYQALTRAKTIPTNLLTVNKLLSTEALRLLHNEFPFRIDVCSIGIFSRYGQIRHVETWDKHVVLAQWQPFRYMRNYCLNIRLNAFRISLRPASPLNDRADYVKEPPNFQVGSERIKEWLRLICDEISSRNIIRSLTITAPCECALRKANFLPKVRARFFDPFTPLKRIEFAGRIRISLHDDVYGEGFEYPCEKPGCIRLERRLQADVGRLYGEELSEQEMTWKDIKAKVHRANTIHATRQEWLVRPDISLDEVWRCLNGHIGEGQSFDEAVKSVHALVECTNDELVMLKHWGRWKA
ncbi:MAG: hypothetical protein Q9170_007309 [Blastenia crenularia]